MNLSLNRLLDYQLGAADGHSIETASFLFFLLCLLRTVLYIVLASDMLADHTAVVAWEGVSVAVIRKHDRGSLKGIVLSTLPTCVLLTTRHLDIITPLLLRLNIYLHFLRLIVIIHYLRLVTTIWILLGRCSAPKRR